MEPDRAAPDLGDILLSSLFNQNVLYFRHVALFRNADDSRWMGSNFRTFCPLSLPRKNCGGMGRMSE